MMTHQEISGWNYSATLHVKGQPELFHALRPEMEGPDDKRARISISLKDDDVIITVDALDINALRSRLNGIAKLISVYEDMKSIANE